MQSLDDLVQYAGTARKVQVLASRDRRLLELTLTLPKAGHTVALACGDTALLDRWLAPST
jgi:hypothetical protein